MIARIHPNNPLSPKAWGRKDTSENCRERAASDLLKSVAMLTANERMILERSAARWALRAEMLEGLQHIATEKRGSAAVSEPEVTDHGRL